METHALARAVLAGDRRALARAITLAESTRPDHRAAAHALLDACAAAGRRAVRVGLTGTPGVGKSTFVEALGMRLVGEGRRVAVLAVDPSSARTGGSILGDKTRMERLARAPGAFVRPSPAAGSLGGLARRTREAAALAEAAGHDVVLVETVGVGQSETAVAEVTDVFALLLAPGGGDELQGVKRGIMEVADLVLVNKADGALRAEAERTRADYAGALRLMRRRPGDPEDVPAALCVSALEDAGIGAAWERVEALWRHRERSGALAAARGRAAAAAFDADLREGLLARLGPGPEAGALRAEVLAGRRAPGAAAAEALAAALDAPGGRR